MLVSKSLVKLIEFNLLFLWKLQSKKWQNKDIQDAINKTIDFNLEIINFQVIY